MAADIHKNYPDKVLEDSYFPEAGQKLIKGCFAFLNSNGKLERAVGATDEYAGFCMTDQSSNFIENGEKVQLVKENGSFWTDQYKVGPSYVPGSKLQVSTNVSEKGIATLHAGGTAPVIGRFIRIESRKNKTMMLFDLVRH